MTDYSHIDWEASMPDAAEVEAGFRNSSISCVTVDRALLAVTELVNRDWVNARAMAAQFQLDLDPRIAFFASRHRLHDIPFFPFFFSASPQTDAGPLDAFLKLFAPLALPAGSGAADTFGFRHESSWVSLAYLASWVSEGGIYSSPRVPDEAIVGLTHGVAGAAFGGRYRAGLSYFSSTPWCEWFYADVRDGSWFWLDLKTGLATILLITDAP